MESDSARLVLPPHALASQLRYVLAIACLIVSSRRFEANGGQPLWPRCDIKRAAVNHTIVCR